MLLIALVLAFVALGVLAAVLALARRVQQCGDEGLTWHAAYRKLTIEQSGKGETHGMKTLVQTTNDIRAVQLLRALGNPIRFRIVQLLADRQECVTGDLVDELPLAQSTVSEHLKVLKDAGIVQGTVDGPYRCYCLEPEALRFLRELFAGLTPAGCC